MLLTFFIFSPLCPLLCFPQYPLCILLAFISITIMLYFSQLVPHFLLCHVLSLIVSNYSCFVVFPHRQLFTTFWCIVFNLNQCFNYNFYLLQGNTSPMNIHCCCSVTKSRPTVCDPISSVQFSSVQWLSHVWLFATPWAAARQASLSISNYRSLLKLMSIESVMPSTHLILCHPLLLQPSIFPRIRVFSSQSVLRIRWQKYWSFSFSISLSSEYSGLISLKMDWLNLLAVQRTLKSLPQHHSSKASILQCSTFYMVQLSYPCMTTGKPTALIRWTLLAK